MEVNIKELIERVKEVKNRLSSMKSLINLNYYYEGLDEDLDKDDFTLAVVIAVLEGINEQENE